MTTLRLVKSDGVSRIADILTTASGFSDFQAFKL